MNDAWKLGNPLSFPADIIQSWCLVITSSALGVERIVDLVSKDGGLPVISYFMRCRGPKLLPRHIPRTFDVDYSDWRSLDLIQGR